MCAAIIPVSGAHVAGQMLEEPPVRQERRRVQVNKLVTHVLNGNGRLHTLFHIVEQIPAEDFNSNMPFSGCTLLSFVCKHNIVDVKVIKAILDRTSKAGMALVGLSTGRTTFMEALYQDWIPMPVLIAIARKTPSRARLTTDADNKDAIVLLCESRHRGHKDLITLVKLILRKASQEYYNTPLYREDTILMLFLRAGYSQKVVKHVINEMNRKGMLAFDRDGNVALHIALEYWPTTDDESVKSIAKMMKRDNRVHDGVFGLETLKLLFNPLANWSLGVIRTVISKANIRCMDAIFPDGTGNTLMMFAAAHCTRSHVMEWLLGQIMPGTYNVPNADGWTLFMMVMGVMSASDTRHQRILERVLTNTNKRMLSWCTTPSDPNLDVHSVLSLVLDVRRDPAIVLRILKQLKPERFNKVDKVLRASVLQIVFGSPYNDTIQQFVLNHTDAHTIKSPDSNGQTAVMKACAGKNVTSLRTLLHLIKLAGGDAMSKRDKNGNTALMLLLKERLYGPPMYLVLLRKFGSVTNFEGQDAAGNTLLMRAIMASQHCSVIHEIMHRTSNAAVNVFNHRGQSAYLLVLQCGSVLHVRLCLSKKTNAKTKETPDENGVCPNHIDPTVERSRS
jgi:hypothetical protein